MLTNIIFDLGGVLFTNGTHRFAEILSQKCKRPISEISYLLNSSATGTAYREGKISRTEFWQHLRKTLNINEDIDALETEWITQYRLIHESHQIIESLHKQKKHVYFLSDNVKERIDRINDLYGFLRWFEGGVFSHEVGIRKPNPKVYAFLLEKYALNPHNSVFIDDKEENLPPAQKLGITPVLFTTPHELQEDLKSLNVLV